MQFKYIHCPPTPKLYSLDLTIKKLQKLSILRKLIGFSSAQTASRYYRKIKWIKLNASAVILTHLIFKLFVCGSQPQKPVNKTIVP